MSASEEFKVAKVSELPQDGGKEVLVNEKKILVGRSNGELFAVTGVCPHYGAPLATGSIYKGRIKCPWHGACFSTKTGDIEDMPGLDSLHTFPIRVEGDDLFVTVKTEQLVQPKRQRCMAPHEPTDKRTFVVVGGGCAGSTAVESIRVTGFKGRLVLLSKESYLPIDRIRLSKGFKPDTNSLLLRNEAFYKQHDIEVILNAEVTTLDVEKKTVGYSVSNHFHTLNYDSILVCTGGTPIPLVMAGSRADNAVTLRTVEDARRIGDIVTAESRVVVVGGSFIGMEVAGTLVKQCASVTVLSRTQYPLRAFGDEIGRSMLSLFEKNGVKYMANASPTKLNVNDSTGLVTSVEASNGEVYPCDLVVAGIGVDFKASTAFIIPTSDMKISDRGIISVDQHLRALHPGVFAAGDIVSYPDPVFGEAHIEHWAVAGSMGRVAGANMVLEAEGKPLQSFNTVPLFWTLNFGKGIRYTGHHRTYDEIIFDKEENGLEVDTLKFAAYYVKNNKVIAVATVARDPLVARSAEFFKHGIMPSPDAIKQEIKEKGVSNGLFV